ncbi:MAG TPA: hypothetical protein G4N94_12015 [Caldilineae bacterium]|nr:hypothetical protein [Caldilineae bacterium]
MNKSILAVALILGLILLFVSATLAGATGGYGLDWWVIASGGHSEGGGYGLDSAIGQPLAGLSSGGSYGLCAGYLCGAAGAESPVYLPLLLLSE